MSGVYPESPLGSPPYVPRLRAVLHDAPERIGAVAGEVARAIADERDALAAENDRLREQLAAVTRDRDDAVALLDGCQRELGLAVDRKREAAFQRDHYRAALEPEAMAARYHRAHAAAHADGRPVKRWRDLGLPEQEAWRESSRAALAEED